MNKKLNNKGFTLVELLAVLAILIAIMAIAIPSISSSLERTKAKQNDSRKRVIESAAELYVADHKNAIYNNLGSNDSCYISIGDINYLTAEELEDADGNPIEGYVIFEKPNTYNLADSYGTLPECYDGVYTICQSVENSSNVSVTITPVTSYAPRYFGKSYELNTTTGEYTLIDTVNGIDGLDAKIFNTHPYICADNLTNNGDMNKTTCNQIFKITGCVNDSCDGTNYIGNYYSATCS